MRLKSYSLLYAALLAGLLPPAAPALDTLVLLDAGPPKVLLESRKPILAETTGQVPVDFDRALEVFSEPTLIQDVQEVYCELIAEDGTPAIVISQSGSNTYFYVTRKGERTDITEVIRRKTDKDTFDLVFYSTGRRFFGEYETVIHVQVTDAGKESVHYKARVYAYPENAFSRFFARHLGLVERYFRKKTAHLAEIITTVSYSLCNEAEKTSGSDVDDD